MQFIQSYYQFLKSQIKLINLPIWFYIFGVSLYSIVFAFITSPPHGLDEGFHFFRALQISQGDLLPSRYNDNTLGGNLDAKMTYYISNMFINGSKLTFTEKQKYVEDLNQLPKQKTIKEIFTPSASYSPVMYIPSATSLFLARKLNLNADTCYFSGRLAGVIAYFLLLSIIIMMLPIGKYFTLLFLTTPATLQIVASYNADGFTNIYTLLFITCCLKSQDIQPTYNNFKTIILILAIILGFLKITYCFFSLFCLFIPYTHFKSKKNYVLFCISTILLSITPAIIWNSLYPFNPGQFFHQQNNPSLALHSLLTQPFHVLKLIIRTTHHSFKNWYLEIYGRLANKNEILKDLFFVKDFSISFLAILFLLILFEPKKQRSYYKMAICFLIGTGYALLLILAFYINYSPIDSSIIKGIQGRYFILSILIFFYGLYYVLPSKFNYKQFLPVLLILNFLCITYEVMKAYVIITN